jgi:hypothetical protein
MVAKRRLPALRFAAPLTKVNSRTPDHVSQAKSSWRRPITVASFTA